MSVSPGESVRYDREVLVNVLVYHQRKSAQFCLCGWGRLGASHPEHVAEVYEQSIAARSDDADGGAA